jgi:glycosyltransferase involved in cell wall biosynthesis
MLRMTAAIVEPFGTVTHVFGGQGSWHLIRALGRRPIVLTAVVAGTTGHHLPHVEFARVVVESELSIDEWTRAGIPRERIGIIRPGVDLDRFQPARSRPKGRLTLLFASTPARTEEIEPRGIGLLIELARQRPDVDILVPWRQWGDVQAARRALDARRPPPNFIVQHGDVPDMRDCYARADATIVCFEPGAGKTCPNFVVEGLACGLPCISTTEVALAPLLERSGAGVVVDRKPACLAQAVDRLRAGLTVCRERARHLAETEFDARRFLAAYEELYGAVAQQP